MKILVKLSCKIHLFFLQMKIVSQGGLANQETWKKQEELLKILKTN